jgi:hypothetical protein
VLEQEVSRGHLHPFKERKGQRPLRSESQISSEEIAPFHAKVLQEVAEFKGTFEVHRNKSQEEERLLEYRQEPRLHAS